jgi:hypothetical protein
MWKPGLFILLPVLTALLAIMRSITILDMRATSAIEIFIGIVLWSAPAALSYRLHATWAKALISAFSTVFAVGIALEICYKIDAIKVDVAMGFFELFCIFCLLIFLPLAILSSADFLRSALKRNHI